MTQALERMEQAGLRREESHRDEADRRLRRSKIAMMALLSILFWFAVPYSLPRHLPNSDPRLMSQDNAEQFEGSASRQIAVPLIGLIGMYMLWRFPRRGRLGGRLFTVALLYMAVVFSSVVWSVDTALTAKRLVVFAFDCLFVYALARTLSTLEMALWTFLTTWFVGILSILSDIFLLKVFAPLDPDYRLTGVMTANHQCMNLVACVLTGMTLLLSRPRWWKWLSVGLLTAVVMLVMTRARVGTVLCLLLLLAMLVKLAKDRLETRQQAMALVLAMLLIVPAVVFVTLRDPARAAQGAFMMGRNDTENTASLSNRLPLWTELMDDVVQRPWLGYGYGAFWTEAKAQKISRDQGWPVPHAHDTYLDQTIVLGAVGGLLYTSLMFSALIVCWRRYARHRTNGNLLNASLLTWLVLLGLSESTPLEPHQPTMLVYAAIVRLCLAGDPDEVADVTEGEPIVEGYRSPRLLASLQTDGAVVLGYAPSLAAEPPLPSELRPDAWRPPRRRPPIGEAHAD